MKAILEFELPEDETQHLAAVKAMDWALALYDVDVWLRNSLKYGMETTEVPTALELARDHLHQTMFDRGISFEELE